MHGEVPLSPVATAMGLGVRYVVPVVCAVIAIDAARRPRAAFGRYGRMPWVIVPLLLLGSLAIGFVAPGVAILALVAVAAVPVALALGVAYLLAVVLPIMRPTGG